jgi:hypothetical protein
MRSVCTWLGFAVAFIVFQFAGRDFFPTPSDGAYSLERAVVAFFIGGAGAVIGRLVGGLLEGADHDSA